MHPEKERAWEHRVASAAETALAHHHYASAIDVLTGMGLLAPAHVQDWRKGRIDFLERVIHANLNAPTHDFTSWLRWSAFTDRWAPRALNVVRVPTSPSHI